MIEAVPLSKIVERNAEEVQRRLRERREQLASKLYNPPTDPAVLAKEAAEAAREVVPRRALNVTRDGASVRDAAPDPEAEAVGGNSRQESSRPRAVEAGVRAPEVPRAEPVRGVVHAGLVVDTYEAETKGEVEAMIPADAVSVKYVKVWRAIVVRRA